MFLLIVVGFAAGVITSLSPCVLPVLPVVLAANADRVRPATAVPANGPAEHWKGADRTTAPATRRRRWRPYGVVAGLVLSFSLSILFGTVLLSALHLPQDLLRDAGIVVLAVIGLSLLIPPLAHLLERPFARLPQRKVNPDSNGIVLGLGLGLLYVPCAGPVLATIAVVGATHRVSFSALVLTLAFGIGAGIPLLVLALAGDALFRRAKTLRGHAREVRLASGVVMILAAAAIGFNLTDGLQRAVPGYTTAMQNAVEGNDAATTQLHKLTTPDAGSDDAAPPPGEDAACTQGGQTLEDCGLSPDIIGITDWLNTPGNQPLSPQELAGKVVLVDFWTYSCINCQRTLPHVEAWYRNYASDGFVVVGVHTPEFAFEHVVSNVTAEAAALGVKYPVAIDNNFVTWNAFGNQYWPAEYLIDGSGTVRHVEFGEGDYPTTEKLIRQLLTIAHPGITLPAATDVPDSTPTGQQTPETYLGYDHEPLSISGNQPVHDKAKAYAFPSVLQPDTFALGGTWTVGPEALVAGAGAKMELSYQADDVYLVLGGSGTVTVSVNGTVTQTLTIGGPPALYTLVKGADGMRAALTLDVSPGVQPYDFTFG